MCIRDDQLHAPEAAPDEVIDLASGDARDPGPLDAGHQRLLRRLPRLQERREVAARPQLGDAQVELTEPGVEGPIP